MKIIVAPDSFKGSLTAQEAADAIEVGIRKVISDADIVKVPMADGGEGTVRSLVDATGGRLVTVPVLNPLGQQVEADYGILGDGTTAVIEMAAASGIQFVDAETKNPLITTTYGTGQLVKDALDKGVRKIIVGLGGSATNDGGAGMAQALGASLEDINGQELDFGGAALLKLDSIDCTNLDPRLEKVEIILASDVTNPLTGLRGASAVFGPQKGANPHMVEQLDDALIHYSKLIHDQLGRDVRDVPGAGAAGGLGAGFLAFTHAVMRPGIEIVVEATKLKDKAVDAQLCITGEGGIDYQTQFGKTPLGTAQAVKSVAPQSCVVAIAGNVGQGIECLYDLGIDAIFGIMPGVATMQDAIEQASANLSRTAENVVRLVVAQQKLD
ncbi:glycerate kinase [Alloscardovia criceti]|uniref:glycerate kinase n=1 Tax=Alloscardovia criceti TaxID=356828 RepID=UPI000372E526|nr:glycerate kinase [Alloscardovia criceti]